MKHLSGWSLLTLLALLLSVSFAAAQSVDSILQFDGTINNDTPFVEFPFFVEEDKTNVIVDLKPIGEGDLDTLVYLVDANGIILAENDDRARGDFSSLIRFPNAAEGLHKVIATRYGVANGDTTGDFQLEISFTHQSLSAVGVYDVSDAALLASGFPDIEVRPRANWTVLAYYGGDNNLEPGVLNDFDEYEVSGGSTTNTRMVMLMDRIPGFTDTSGDWESTRLFEVQPDATHDHGTTFPPTIDSAPLADMGEMDMGDGQTLAQYLVWGIKHFPADHYAITFASHGAGWQGLTIDDTSQRDILSLPELEQAFSLAKETAGVDKFDLLVNDACLMGSVEYHAAVAPFFTRSLASPELVVDPALDMTQFTQSIIQNPDVALDELGTELVNTYIQRDILERGGSDIVYLTNSVTNLNNFDPVVAAVDNFAGRFNQNPQWHAAALGEARANTYAYAQFIGGHITYVDLGDLMRRFITLSDDQQLIAAAEQVLQALQEALVYGSAGERAARRSTYYNIYFPEESRDYDLNYLEQSPLVEWGRLLRNYFNTMTPQVWSGDPLLSFHSPTAPKVTISSVFPATASILQPVTVNMEVVARFISHGTITIDRLEADGSHTRLYDDLLLKEFAGVDENGEVYVEYYNEWDAGIDDNGFVWDVRLPTISDGTNTNFEQITLNEEVAVLDGRYREPNMSGANDWRDVSVVFDLQDGTVQRVINRVPGTGALAVIRITPGSEFQAYRNVVQSDGRTAAEPGNLYIWGQSGLTWDFAPAPTGEYDLGFTITAFGGTTGFAKTTVHVNDDNLPPGLTGYTDFINGFNFAYPDDWSTVNYLQDEMVYSTENPEGDAEILIYTTDALEVAPEDVVFDYLYVLGFDSDEQYTPLVVNGYNAQEFSYTYSNDFGDWTARAFVIQPRDGYTAIFAVNTTADSAVDRDALFNQIVEQANFFDPTIEAPDTGAWSFAGFGADTDYPIPTSWADGIEDGIWTLYTPDGDPNNLDFVRVTRTEGSDARQTLADLLAQYVEPMPDYHRVRDGSYFSENASWELAAFTGTRQGQAVMGRMYTMIANGFAYALWFETPLNDDAAARLATTYEPMLDGFLIFDMLKNAQRYVDPDYGFSFLYPANWLEAEYNPVDNFIAALDFADTERISAFRFEDETNSLQDTADFFLEIFGLDQESPFQPSTIAGHDALVFDVSYIDDNTDYLWNGRAVAFYLPEQNLGLVFLAEVVEDGDIELVYTMMRDHIELAQ